jgi:hypothetical protein
MFYQMGFFSRTIYTCAHHVTNSHMTLLHGVQQSQDWQDQEHDVDHAEGQSAESGEDADEVCMYSIRIHTVCILSAFSSHITNIYATTGEGF